MHGYSVTPYLFLLILKLLNFIGNITLGLVLNFYNLVLHFFNLRIRFPSQFVRNLGFGLLLNESVRIQVLEQDCECDELACFTMRLDQHWSLSEVSLIEDLVFVSHLKHVDLLDFTFPSLGEPITERDSFLFLLQESEVVKRCKEISRMAELDPQLNDNGIFPVCIG